MGNIEKNEATDINIIKIEKSFVRKARILLIIEIILDTKKHFLNVSQCEPPATVLIKINDTSLIIKYLKYPRSNDNNNPTPIVKVFENIINIEYS